MSFALKDNKYLRVLACWLAGFKTRSCYPELVNLGVLLPQFPRCWDYRCAAPWLSLYRCFQWTLPRDSHYTTESGHLITTLSLWYRIRGDVGKKAAFGKVSVMRRSLSEGTTSAEELYHKINNQNRLSDRASGKGQQATAQWEQWASTWYHGYHLRPSVRARKAENPSGSRGSQQCWSIPQQRKQQSLKIFIQKTADGKFKPIPLSYRWLYL